MGGGKTSTSSSTVTIPPEVLARYNAVNAQAEQVAQTPFQQYSTDPNAFVAPINQTQQSGINQIQSNMGSAQPYYDTATQLTMAGAGPANLGQLNTNQYMSPYLQNVVGTTLAAQQMQNAQQASQLQGQQATQGAFGGDRGNIGLSNLAYQQNLANQQALAGQLQSGYTQAQNVAAQQQGADLAAQQANLARLTQAGQAIGGLGTAAQNAAITGGQAALTAGTVPQQTQQAGLTALYNQFLQQQGYPFQTTQFLANIAEGTGALSGSTTTNTGPSSFFSDERLKDDVETIGKTFDGQKIVKFRYKGQHGPKQIGLVAQDVEKHHPEAVGEQNGYKTVDYDKATDKAARRGHYYAGGLVANSQGGAVGPEHAGLGFAGGGLVDPMDLQQLVAARAQMYAPYASGGLYGQQNSSTPGAKGVVPSGNLPTPKLVTASTPSTQQAPVGKQIMSDIGDLKEGVSDFNWAKQGLMGTPAQSYTKDGSTYTTPAQPGLISQAKSWLDSSQQQPSGNARGGVIGRHHYDDGGEVDDNKDHAIPYGGDSIVGEVAKEGEKSPQMLKAAQTAQAGGQGSTVGNLLGAASTLKGLYGLGSDVAGGLGNLAGGFNAATNAGTLDSVLGSGFTAENIGLGAGGASAAGTGLMGSIGSGLGSFFSSLGPAAMFLPFKDGGVVPQREHHDGSEGNVVGNPPDDSSDNAQTYIPNVITDAFNKEGVDPQIGLHIAAHESQFSPNAQNQNSSAGGLFQFTDGTWKRYGSGQDKFDPVANAQAGARFIKDNQTSLQNAGFEPNLTNTYLAHFLGAEGAKKVLSDPDANIKDTVSPKAIESNPFLAKMNTNSDLINWASQSMAQTGASPKTARVAPGLAGGQESQGIFGQIGSAADSVGNWYDRNQNWLVPLATGLGTMASSPSRYLGAAILQGIGGAAQASQRQQLQQSQIAKNTFDLINNTYTTVPDPKNPGKFLTVSKFDPNHPIPSDQFYANLPNVLKGGTSNLGSLAGPQAPSAPSAPTPVGGTPQQTKPVPAQGQQQAQGPQQAQAQPSSGQQPTTNGQPKDPYQDYLMSNPISDIQQLRSTYASNPSSQAAQLNRAADDASNQAYQFRLSGNKDAANQKESQAAQLRLTANTTENADVSKLADLYADNRKQQQTANLTTQNDAMHASTEAVSRKATAQQLLNTLFDQDGNPRIQTGGIAEWKANVAKVLNSAGVDSSWTDKFITNPAIYDEIKKGVTPLAIENVKAALGGDQQRVSQFKAMLQDGSPDPASVDARAIKFMIQNAIVPQADKIIQKGDYLGGMDPAKHNIIKAAKDFDKANPFYIPPAGTEAQKSTQSTPNTQVQQQAQSELIRRQAAAELARRQAASGNQ